MKKYCIVVLVCGLSLAAYADLELGGFSAMWGPNGTGNGQMNMSDPVNGEGDTYILEETWDIPDNCFIQFDMTYDPDPYVLFGLAVTNNAAFPQSFMFTYNAPASTATTTVYGGSVSGSYTINDTDGDGLGSVTTTSPMPLYQGLIDGVAYLPLYPDPQSWGALAGDSGTIAPASSPITNPGPVVSSNIDVIIRLTLTPGETATLNGNFVVNPIPEPATMTILGLGAVLLRKRKR